MPTQCRPGNTGAPLCPAKGHGHQSYAQGFLRVVLKSCPAVPQPFTTFPRLLWERSAVSGHQQAQHHKTTGANSQLA